MGGQILQSFPEHEGLEVHRRGILPLGGLGWGDQIQRSYLDSRPPLRGREVVGNRCLNSVIAHLSHLPGQAREDRAHPLPVGLSGPSRVVLALALRKERE
jgi:hypothetical protein